MIDLQRVTPVAALPDHLVATNAGNRGQLPALYPEPSPSAPTSMANRRPNMDNMRRTSHDEYSDRLIATSFGDRTKLPSLYPAGTSTSTNFPQHQQRAKPQPSLTSHGKQDINLQSTSQSSTSNQATISLNLTQISARGSPSTQSSDDTGLRNELDKCKGLSLALRRIFEHFHGDTIRMDRELVIEAADSIEYLTVALDNAREMASKAFEKGNGSPHEEKMTLNEFADSYAALQRENKALRLEIARLRPGAPLVQNVGTENGNEEARISGNSSGDMMID